MKSVDERNMKRKELCRKMREEGKKAEKERERSEGRRSAEEMGTEGW